MENEIKKIWVAGGESDNGLYYSEDGKIWTQSNIISDDFSTVYHSKNKKIK